MIISLLGEIAKFTFFVPYTDSFFFLFDIAGFALHFTQSLKVMECM